MINESSNLAEFKKYIEDITGVTFQDYEELWSWSIHNSDKFWEQLLNYFQIIYHKKYEKIKEGEKLSEIKWFPGMTLNYSEHIFRHFNSTKTALLYQAENEVLSAVTWEEMRKKTAAIQSYFKKEGIKIGDRICAILPNIPEASYSFFATNGLGAIWSSCSPDFGKLAVEERFGMIEPTLLIAVPTYQYGGKVYDKRENIREICSNIPSIKKIVWISKQDFNLEKDEIFLHEILKNNQEEELTFEPLPFDHPLYILFSSGTTGQPKAIIHRQGGILLEHLKYLVLHNEVKKEEKYFWFTNTGWMMWNFIQSTFAIGAIPILYNGSPTFPDEKTLWKLAEQAEINHFGTSPAYLTSMAKTKIKPGFQFNLSKLKTISSTGSPISIENFQFIENSFPSTIPVISMSGGTDVCTAFVGGCSLKPINHGHIQARCLGAAIFSFDEKGNMLINKEGELVITKPMPSMPLGFWNDPGNNRYIKSYFNRFQNIWCHGDWLTVTNNGEIIISGRSDATLNRYGIRIGTAEIYRALGTIQAITDSLIIHVKISQSESKLILFVCLTEKYSLDENLEQLIKQVIKTNYSPRHVPDEIYRLNEIPYTLSGKKIELPVKKLYEGENNHLLVSKESLRNPKAWEELLQTYDLWKIKREIKN